MSQASLERAPDTGRSATSGEADPFGDLSVLTPQPHLLDRYRRIVLVAAPHQLDGLGELGGDTLVVTTEWLTWRRCTDRGLHCLHYESVLGEWPAEAGDPNELYRRGCEWAHVDGVDVTRFLGVSLGRQFSSEVGYAILAFTTTHAALDRICRRFRPSEVVLVDLSSVFGVLEPPLLRRLAEDVAAGNNAVLIDRLDHLAAGHAAHHNIYGYGPAAAETGFKPAARRFYAWAVELASRARWLLGGRKPKVLVWLNNKSLAGAAGAFRGGRIAPVILSESAPKSASFVGQCLRSGISLSRLPAVVLTGEEETAIDGMIDRLERQWRNGGDVFLDAQRTFVQSRLFNTGRLRDMARLVKSYHRLFRKHRFRRVVVADATNARSAIACELAAREGIPADELLNGIFLTAMKDATRSGDVSARPVVTRQLAWGAVGQRWIKAVEPSMDCVITGYPALDGLRDRAGKPKARSQWRRALLLSTYANLGDPRALRANISSTMVSMARVLRDNGFDEIRVKLHPGADNKTYFEDMLDYFGLACTVLGNVPLEDQVEWADVVVGPVNSGAFVETLAMGKPYFAVRPEPSSIDEGMIEGIEVISSAQELERLLKGGHLPDGESALDILCGIREHPNPSQRFWRVLEESIAP